MNKAVRYSITAVITVCFAAGTLILSDEVRDQHRLKTCTGLDISFPDSLKFVSEDDVKGYLDSRYGAYIGQRLDSVELFRIEEIIQSSSAVKSCEAWTTDDGTLHLSVSQREPVIRFMKGRNGFYVDGTGYIFPLHSSFTAQVMTVEGDIPVSVSEGFKGEAATDEEKEWIYGMLSMYRQLSSMKALKGRMSKIDVTGNGDIVLTLTDDPDERFILGSTDDIKSKLDRIEKYRTVIRPTVGDRKYNTINVKYKGQIICRTTGI